MDWNDPNWKHYDINIRWMDDNPNNQYLVVPSNYGGIDYMDKDYLTPFLYAQIYISQPNLFKELHITMTEDIRNEILMMSI